MVWFIRHQHDHYYHPEHGLNEVKALLLQFYDLTTERFKYMSKELDDLTAQVKKNSDLLGSATAAINGIAARIDAAVAAATAAGASPQELAQITELARELKDGDDTLAAAILASTPAAPSSNNNPSNNPSNNPPNNAASA